MPTRTIRAGHRGIRGRFPSRKAGRMVAFESRLERDHLLLLEADPNVKTFEEQPVTIEFEGARGRRRYTPDCRVEYIDGTTELVEVKYAADLDALDAEARADLAEAQDAARRHCARFGWRFRVVTDRDIRTPALVRAETLRMYARAPSTLPTLRPRIEAHLGGREGVTLAELVATVAHPETRACVLHLVWVGELVAPSAEDSAVVRRRDARRAR